MSYGLISAGQKFKDEGMQGLSDVAAMEHNRDEQNKRLKEQKRGTEANAMMSGAMSGAMLGMQTGSVGGPMGAAIGLVAGYLLS